MILRLIIATVIYFGFATVSFGANENWSVSHQYGFSDDVGNELGTILNATAGAELTGATPDHKTRPPETSQLHAHALPAVGGLSYADATFFISTSGSNVFGNNNTAGVALVDIANVVAQSYATSDATVQTRVPSGNWVTKWSGNNLAGAIDPNVGPGNAHVVLIDPVVVLTGDPESPTETELFSSRFEGDNGAFTTWEDNRITIGQEPGAAITGYLEVSVSNLTAAPGDLRIQFADGAISDDPGSFVGTGVFEQFRICNDGTLAEAVLEARNLLGTSVDAIDALPLLLDEDCNQLREEVPPEQFPGPFVKSFNLAFTPADLPGPILGMKLSGGGLKRRIGADVYSFHDFTLSLPFLETANEDSLIPGAEYAQVVPGAGRPDIIPDPDHHPFAGFARSNLNNVDDAVTLLFDRNLKTDTADIFQIQSRVELRELGIGAADAKLAFGFVRTATYGPEGSPAVALEPFDDPTTVDGITVEIDPVDSMVRLHSGPGVAPIEEPLDPLLLPLLEGTFWSTAELTIQNQGSGAIVSASILGPNGVDAIPLFEDVLITGSVYSDDDRPFVAAKQFGNDDVSFDINELMVTRRRVGDLNLDGFVNIADLDDLDDAAADLMFAHDAAFDLNFDGSIDLADVGILEMAFPGLLIGDANGDGSVGFEDFVTLSRNFGSDVDSRTQGDFDGNGRVDFPDFLQLRANFGQATSQPVSVPEPSGSYAVLCSAAGLLVLCRKRRCGERTNCLTQQADYVERRNTIHAVAGKGIEWRPAG